MTKIVKILAGTAMLLSTFSVGENIASAASFVSTMAPKVVIQGSCNLINVKNLKFGTHGLLTTNIDATTTMKIKCSNSTSFNIGIDGGTTPGGTTAVRKMYNGTETVDFTLFQDAGRTINWGDTIGTDTLSATGTGSNVTYTIYGRVPIQSIPSPDTYTDVVTVIVTF